MDDDEQDPEAYLKPRPTADSERIKFLKNRDETLKKLRDFEIDFY